MKDMKRALALLSVILMFSLSSVVLGQEMRNGYDLIVKNNLFRPLGWAPQPHVPSYELLITKLHPDGNRAMIRVDGKTYYVKEGDKVGELVINRIEERKVEIQDGDQTRELQIEISGVVGGGGGRGGSRGRGGGAPFTPGRDGSQPAAPVKTDVAMPMNIPQGAFNRIPANIRERFQNASPEERRQMIREFRERMGRNRGGDRPRLQEVRPR